MPKFQVNDPNTGKKYVITAPDQASAVAAFQKFSGGGSGRPSFNNDAEARAYATDPANRDALNARASQQGALTRPDPRVGLAMPGTPNTTPLKPDPAFDVTNPYSNPLNAERFRLGACRHDIDGLTLLRRAQDRRQDVDRMQRAVE